MDSISKYLTDVTLHLRMSPLSIRNPCYGNVCQVFFHTCDEEMNWAPARGRDNNNKQTWSYKQGSSNKNNPSPLTVALLPAPGCKSLCVSFSLSSHTFRDMGSENVPIWVLVQGNIWIRDTGLKEFRVTSEEVIKGDGSAGPGKWKGRLNFVFLSNQKHLQPQKQILIAADAKGIFFMFKVESIIFSPSFQTCSLASNLPNASLSYSLF